MKNPRDLMLMRGVSNCLCPTQSFPCAGAMRGMSMSTNASNSSAVLWSLDSLHCFHSQCTFNDHPPFEIPSAIKRDKLHLLEGGRHYSPGALKLSNRCGHCTQKNDMPSLGAGLQIHGIQTAASCTEFKFECCSYQTAAVQLKTHQVQI